MSGIQTRSIMSFTLHYLGKNERFDEKVALHKLLLGEHSYLCAKVNNRVRDLNYEVYYDASIEFLTIKDQDAIRIYETSLRYLISMALFQIDPEIQFRFSYYVSRSIFLEFTSFHTLNASFIKKLDEKMKAIVQRNVPFSRLIFQKEEAVDIYKKMKMEHRLAFLSYRPEKTVHFYEAEGYYNYMYGPMVLSSKMITAWQFLPYANGMIIQYPRSETKGLIPEFEDAPIYGQTLKDSKQWSLITKADSVSAINQYIEKDQVVDFINLSEAKHARMLVELGEAIEKRKEDLRLICIAGPSSSGKTTFANRLRIELMSRGIRPIRISIDDYYLPKSMAPKDADGKPDLESINALDLPSFNHDLSALVRGETITLPTSKFDNHGSHESQYLQISKDTIIIIEGIHALNDMLSSLIPRSQKYKIYISPQAQIYLDEHNPISLTDLRLLRRMVRDKKYRNSSAEETIDMWPSVRRGEFKWIYKTQEEADYVYNSFLPYELSVMKRYGMPLLTSIDKESVYFPTAERLMRLLKYFLDIDEKWIPSNSLIREFIGGSCFREVDD